jgi:ATP-dependent Lhr-like helicase
VRQVADLPFHPAVSTWFRGAFPGPTPIQERAWPLLAQGKDVLLAAPTGSGKTLCAFLASLSELWTDSLRGELKRELRVLYVSPLKALGNDIERNLQGPLAGIANQLRQADGDTVPIVTAVRSGDTSTKERVRMLKDPPHVLVTTPESLYILLTSERGRQLLGTTRTVIIDEIHALLPSKRGAHLALSLERLDALCRERTGKLPQRIGLSATMRPLSEVRDYLCGSSVERQAACEVIDEGHTRPLHIELWVPGSPLEAITSAEVWTEIYDELARRIREQRTTLVFCNTRKQTERVSRFLEERLGPDQVASHHGSLAKQLRERAERKLAGGQLRALVATASLELGIDVGEVELVCQLGSPGSIATLLQRVGRAGHQVGATSRGLLIPTSRDQLVECLALLSAQRSGALETLAMAEAPLDILAQQAVAILASGDHLAEDLLHLLRGASPYRTLEAQDFESVVRMLEDGFATARGRRSAYVHRDETSNRLHARRGARLAAITSGGAIPDSFDYEVLLMPEDLRVGSVHEDFAIESSAGDVFQLGNRSYQIEKVDPGTVRVRDATGMPPNLPFWLGEAPSRSNRLSEEVSTLRRKVAELDSGTDRTALTAWAAGLVVPPAALEQVQDYLGTTQRMLGVMPSEERLVVERFFDQVGGMHVVLHSTFGSRVNRGLGLLLRKRFCRGFNVELQAAAGEDAILLSLGPMHSFPLDDLRHYLSPLRARETLVQALLDSPMFQTRFRWNASRALAILRLRGGRRVPPRFQRMDADDLLAQCFPDQVACLENIQGEREIPDHPLVRQTIDDCLHEAMDVVRLERLLSDIGSARVEFLTRDVTEPSPLAHEILSARPYAFLDDAPLEERRAQAVHLRRQQAEAPFFAPARLTQQAIQEVLAEARPDPRDADELHDALATYVFFLPTEIADFERAANRELAATLIDAGRAVWIPGGGKSRLVAMRNVDTLTHGRAGDDSALDALVRGRLEWAGPITAAEVADLLCIPVEQALAALHRLERAGFLLRGQFRAQTSLDEFCERRLLARMHRATLGQARREIEPVSPAQLLEFFTRFQCAHPGHRRRGIEGTWQTIAQLAHFPASAADWEEHILPARIADYDPTFLDALTESGRVAWMVPARGGRRLSRNTPVILAPRHELRDGGDPGPELRLSSPAEKVLARLRSQGAAFPSELFSGMTLLPTQTEALLAELISAGIVSTDGFCGLRALIGPKGQQGLVRWRGGRRRSSNRVSTLTAQFSRAGRLSLTPPFRSYAVDAPDEVEARETELEVVARRLLRRWGIVVRHLLAREPDLPPWRDLLRVFHRLEARGEIRGGRFVTLYSGEQFALPEALPLLRRCQKEQHGGDSLELSASDPLNLTGFITPETPPTRGAGRLVLLRGGHYEVLSSTAERAAALVRSHHRS